MSRSIKIGLLPLKSLTELKEKAILEERLAKMEARQEKNEEKEQGDRVPMKSITELKNCVLPKL